MDGGGKAKVVATSRRTMGKQIVGERKSKGVGRDPKEIKRFAISKKRDRQGWESGNGGRSTRLPKPNHWGRTD